MQVQPSAKFSLDALERHAMFKHLAVRMRAERFYAIPVAAAPLERVPSASAKPLDDGDLEIDAPEARMVSQEPMAYVKLVARNLTRQRLGPVPLAASTPFHTQDVCVARHDTWTITSSPNSGVSEAAASTGRIIIQVEPRSWHQIQDHLSVLALCRADVQSLRQSMMAYSARTQLHCKLMGLPTAMAEKCREALRLLVLNNAFPERFLEVESVDGVCLSASQREEQAGMDLLQSAGYVEAIQSQGCVVWRYLGGPQTCALLARSVLRSECCLTCPR